MNEVKKTAIVCSNGGMRSAYGAGFLYTLATKLGITSSDIMVGSSGNVGNMLYFCAGQFEEIKNAWHGKLSTSKFISYTRMPVMDINYLVDTIFKKENPLNLVALRESVTRYHVPIADVKSGTIEYISNDNDMDPYDLLRAAKTMPIICDGPVTINNREYMDGGLGTTLRQHTLLAKRHGATHILVIDNANGIKWFVKIALYTFGWLRSPRLYLLFVKLFKRIERERVKEKHSGVQVLKIKPSRHIPVGLLTRDEVKLQKAFELGAQDVLAHEQELRDLFT